MRYEIRLGTALHGTDWNRSAARVTTWCGRIVNVNMTVEAGITCLTCHRVQKARKKAEARRIRKEMETQR